MNASDSTMENNNDSLNNISLNETLSKKIEAILFWKSEPVSVKKLSLMLSTDESKIQTALTRLEKTLQGRGIVLVKNGTGVYLATGPDASELIKKITMDEESAELGRASLETLSIILYKSPIRRSEVDYIRGVNSSFIIRSLLVRGLVQKNPDPRDSRTSLYTPSFELLGHLGVTDIKNLPDFEKVQEEIQKFKAEKEHADQAIHREPEVPNETPAGVEETS